MQFVRPTATRIYARTPKEADAALCHFDPTGGALGLDIETCKSLDPTQGSILLLQLSDGERTVVINRRAINAAVRDTLELILAEPLYLKVGHNLDYEYRWIKHHLGISLSRVYDTQVGEQLLRMGLDGSIPSLEELALKYEDKQLDKSVRLEFIEQDPDTYEAPAHHVDYAAWDAEIVLPIMREQTDRMRQLGLTRGAKLRMDMLPVIGDMELEGAPIDVEGWRRTIDDLKIAYEKQTVALLDELTPPILEIRAEEFEVANRDYLAWKAEYDHAKACNEQWATDTPFGTQKERRAWINAENRVWKEQHAAPDKPKLDVGPINLNSHEQLKKVYGRLGVPLESTEAKELEHLVGEHPTIRPLLEWKKNNKIIGTYGDSLLEAAERDGRIHPSFNLVVSTGRMSCRDPNIQNCPVILRDHFVAPEGAWIVVADFSQIELRITADLSGDPLMIENYERGRDLHTTTAARMVGIDYDEAMDRLARYKEAGKAGREPRPQDAALYHARNDNGRGAKTANFRILYGGQDPELVRIFSTTFPTAWEWIKEQGRLGWTRGYTESLSGLRRFYLNHYPADCENRWSYRSRIERQAMNHPIQGTSADITMLAAVWVRQQLSDALRLWNLVHDELDGLVYGTKEHAAEIGERVRALSIDAGKHFLKRVPVEVEVAVARNWSK